MNRLSRWRKACRSLPLLAVALLHLPQAGPGDGRASAAEPSDVVRTEGVTLRLVADAPEPDGTFRGAVVLDLEPGWKTYWIDPGEAGIPPVLDFSGSRGVAEPSLRYPVPHRFGEGLARSVGYGAPTAIAFRSAGTGAGAAPLLRLRISLGVCRDICIPVVADLRSEVAEPAAGEAALVDWAFAALPDEVSASQGRVRASLDAAAGRLTVRARLPPAAGAANPEIFVAGPAGWSFDAPRDIRREGAETVFEIPVLSSAAPVSPEPLAVDAVMSRGEWAVNFAGIAVDIR